MAHNGSSAGDGTHHIPLAQNNYNPDWDTGVNVRNIGSSSTNATVTYRPINQGGTYYSTLNIPASGTGNFYFPGLSFPTGTYGIATITTSPDQPLVATHNTTKYSADVAVSHNTYLETDGTATINFPLVMKNASGWATGIQVHNIGSASTDVEVRYYHPSGTYTNCKDGPITVQAGQGYNSYQPQNGCLSNGFVGSATVIASGGDSRIVGELIATNYGASYAFGYNGVNR